MNIEVRCNGCDKNLIILDKVMVPGTDTLRLDVASCGSIDCANCVGCEDLELLKEVQKELEVAKRKLKDRKMEDEVQV